jgi:hypothetical protein
MTKLTILSGIQLTDLAKLFYFDAHCISDGAIKLMMESAKKTPRQKPVDRSYCATRSQNSQSIVFREFLLPTAYALYAYHKRQNSDLSSLKPVKKISILREFVEMAPVRLNKRMWKEVSGIVDFETIFGDTKKLDEERAALLKQWANILVMKMVFGLLYSLDSLSLTKRSRKHIEKFRNLPSRDNYIAYKPDLTTVPIVRGKGSKGKVKEEDSDEEDELALFAASSNMTKVNQKRKRKAGE